MQTAPVRLCVMLSGGGRTLQNLIDRIEDGNLHAKVTRVISSSKKAFGLERARRHGIETVILRRRRFDSVETFSEAIAREIRGCGAELTCMAGWMLYWVIPDDLMGRVINIHPALIPSFCGKGLYGMHVHEAAIRKGVKISGCTVHFADNIYDHGPIILQRAVTVLEDDTPESLAHRVFQEECIAYPEAIRLFRQGRLQIEGERVRVLPPGDRST